MQQPAESDTARTIITAGDRLRAEGFIEGFKEGFSEGFKEAFTEAFKESFKASLEADRRQGLALANRALLTLLEARGVAVADAVRARIEQCSDLQTVEQWLLRAPTVATAEELFSA